jgi:hypothetical protein
MNILKTVGGYLKSAARSVVNFLDRNSTKIVAGVSAAVLMVGQAFAQTDATTIATDAQAAFATIAPITITIAGFYVILHLAKRVVK